MDPLDYHRDLYNGCARNSSSTFDIHSLNLLEKTASDKNLCHFFSLRPTRHKFDSEISSFCYHFQNKLRGPTSRPSICSDLEFGVIFPHRCDVATDGQTPMYNCRIVTRITTAIHFFHPSALHRTQTKTAFYNLSQRSFPYSEISPRYGDILNHR